RHTRHARKRRGQLVDHGPHGGERRTLPARLHEGERLQDLLLALLAEVGQGADLPGARRGFEVGERAHAEPLVEDLHRLRPHALERGERGQIDRHAAVILLAQPAFPAREQLLQLLGHRGADAGDVAQGLHAARAVDRVERPVVRLDGLRRLLVGARLEGHVVHVEVGGDVPEDARQLGVAHRASWVARPRAGGQAPGRSCRPGAEAAGGRARGSGGRTPGDGTGVALGRHGPDGTRRPRRARARSLRRGAAPRAGGGTVRGPAPRPRAGASRATAGDAAGAASSPARAGRAPCRVPPPRLPAYLAAISGRRCTVAPGLAVVRVGDGGERRLFAVAGYNAGEGRVPRAQARAAAAGGDPTRFTGVRRFLPGTTQGYVDRVVAYARAETAATAVG